MLIITTGLRSWLQRNKGAPQDATDDDLRRMTADAIFDKNENPLDPQQLRQWLHEDVQRKAKVRKNMSTTPTKVFGGTRVDVLPTSHGYRTEKSIGRHSRLGIEVLDEKGKPCELSSDLERAKMGVFLKYLAGRSGLPVTLSESERSLWNETLEKDLWCGLCGGQWHTDIDGARVKTLLSDSTSGGIEVNPSWFDTNLIVFPLLNSELFSLVDLRELPRGSSVEGAGVSNPTAQWGVPEGSAIEPFDTDDLIAAINTTIHPVTCAVEVGRDFLSDSAADVGRVLEAQIGARLLSELDNVIANGNGTDRPEGIFTASGITTVPSDNGNPGPPTIGDLESLLFAVGKQYRTSNRCAFLSNDTTYRRARTIAVDTSGDQRLVLGMDLDRGSGAAIESYSALGRPWKIQNDIANTRAAFGDLSRYRMYRRLGMRVEWHTSGKELALRNTVLLVVRARFGGRVVDASAFAKMTDLQS